MLDEIEQKAISVIDNAQNAANNTINNAAYNTINTAVQIREEYKDALHLTVAELTTQQRIAFEGIESRIEQLFTNIESEHDRIDDTLDNIATYLSDTIFLSDEPTDLQVSLQRRCSRELRRFSALNKIQREEC